MPDDRISTFKPKGLKDYIEGHRHYSDDHIDAIIATCPGGLPEGDVDIQEYDQDVDRLVTNTVDRRTALKARLERVAAWYVASRALQDKPAPSVLRDQFAIIAKESEHLLDAIRFPDGGSVSDIPPAIREPLEDGIEAIAARAAVTGADDDSFRHHLPTRWEAGDISLIDFHGDSVLADAIRGIILLRDSAAEASSMESDRVAPPTDRNRHQGDIALKWLIQQLTDIWVEVCEQRVGTSVGGPESPNKGEASGPLIRFVEACLTPLNIDGSSSGHAIRERVRRLNETGDKSNPKKS